MNNVDEREDFAFANEDATCHMPERLNFCVGGVNVKMLIDSSNVIGENAWEIFKAESK